MLQRFVKHFGNPLKILHPLGYKNFSSDIPKPVALRSKKPKSKGSWSEYFIDSRAVRASGGKGGDGYVNFLQLWSNENAGPDGGDGGNGGHVIFQADSNVSDLKHFSTDIKAEDGEKGGTKDCCGRNAKHTVIKVPIGTVIKDTEGNIVGDLNKQDMMFLAARGGAGGHGNHFFATDQLQSPHIAEYGAIGEDIRYFLEVKTIAHIGLVGMPNAGKSTLLRALSRAKPKVAPVPFTTLKPHLGMVEYSDYEQISIADLPGLVEGSHQNRGLGIQFLKHVERCLGFVYVIDVSNTEPWKQLDVLKFELTQFNAELTRRPLIIVANKMDLKEAQDNIEEFESNVNLPVLQISAKTGKNLVSLLDEIRKVYDSSLSKL